MNYHDLKRCNGILRPETCIKKDRWKVSTGLYKFLIEVLKRTFQSLNYCFTTRNTLDPVSLETLTK
jgi:hypothetical protein